MNIGFIGLGNMAQAMLGGIIKKELVEPCDIYAWDISEASRKNVGEKLGINILDSNEEVADKADFLFLAVKPGVVEGVIKEIREHVRPETVVVSIAAGKSLSFLLNAFSKPEVKVIRCMPNTPALVGMGCTAVTPSETVEVGELEKTLTILRSFGKAEVVAEYLMDAVVGVSGSSPAYVFMFIEAMADAAVQGGMPRKLAYEFAAQSVMGSAKLMLETGKHPGELKDMVCSPAGTTIEAVKVLEEDGFRGTVMNAVAACIEKSASM